MRHPGGAPPTRGCPGLHQWVRGLRGLQTAATQPTPSTTKDATLAASGIGFAPESAGVHPLAGRRFWAAMPHRVRPNGRPGRGDVPRCCGTTGTGYGNGGIRTQVAFDRERKRGSRGQLGRVAQNQSTCTSMILATYAAWQQNSAARGDLHGVATSTCATGRRHQPMTGQTSTPTASRCCRCWA